MNADDSLLGILGVDFVFGFSVFFRNGKNAQGGKRFERVGRLWMDHPDAHGEIVGKIAKRQRNHDADQDAFNEDAWRDHTAIRFPVPNASATAKITLYSVNHEIDLSAPLLSFLTNRDGWPRRTPLGGL